MPKLYRKYGQVLLKNASIARFEAESLNLAAGSTVLEIGAGKGILTSSLLEHGYRVIAVETDHRFVEFLASEFSDRIEADQLSIINGDILKIRFPENIDGIAGNIPYNISSALIEKLCSERFTTAVLMFQREFGARLISIPGTASFSLTSALAYLAFETSLIRKVGRSNFSPVPEVDSVIVKLLKRQNQLSVEGLEFLISAFSNRRKKLKNISESTPAGFGDLRIDELDRLQFDSLINWVEKHHN